MDYIEPNYTLIKYFEIDKKDWGDYIIIFFLPQIKACILYDEDTIKVTTRSKYDYYFHGRHKNLKIENYSGSPYTYMICTHPYIHSCIPIHTTLSKLCTLVLFTNQMVSAVKLATSENEKIFTQIIKKKIPYKDPITVYMVDLKEFKVGCDSLIHIQLIGPFLSEHDTVKSELYGLVTV